MPDQIPSDDFMRALLAHTFGTKAAPRFSVGQRVLVCGREKYAGTITQVIETRTRTLYDVKFDDYPTQRIPPQTAIGVREEDLELEEPCPTHPAT